MSQQAEIDAQSRALTAAIAQNGSQGQVAFQAQQARQQAAQKAAAATLAGQSKMTGSAGNAPAEFTQQLQAQQDALGSVYAQDSAMSQAAFNNSIMQSALANQNYASAASAAAPVVQGQTAGIVAQIKAEKQAAAEARAAAAEERRWEAEQRRLDAIEAAQEREFRKKELEVRLRELEGSSTNGMTEEEIAADQGKVLGRAERVYSEKGRPGVSRLINEVVAASQSLPEAMDRLSGMAAQGVPDADGNATDISDEELFDAQRYVYEVFNGNGSSAKGSTEFRKQVAAEGGDPNRVPDYYTEAEKKYIRGGDKKGQESSSSGSWRDRALSRIASGANGISPLSVADQRRAATRRHLEYRDITEGN